MHQSTSIQTLSIGALALLLMQTASAQTTPGPGYAIKRLDGDNDVSQHFAFSNVSGNQRIGFYYLADRAALVSGACSSARCTITSTLTSIGDRGQFVSAAALPGNFSRPLVAYYDATNQDLRAGVCSDNFRCDAFASDRVLDSGGDVGQHTSMAINPATGFAVISYYVATLGVGDARLYACSNADCSAGSAQSIETSGDVGRNSALAFGADLGNFTNLFAVYDNVSTGQVRFARAVAPYNAFGAIDLGAGSDPAISVGSSGFPVIVYRGADDSLKHVRCLSFDCSGANQVTQTLSPPGFGAPSVTHLRNSLGVQTKLFITTQQQGTGAVWAILCDDSTCANSGAGMLEAGPGLGGASIASNLDNGPIAFYHDAIAKDVRATDLQPASGSTQGVSVNGFSASLPNVAIRSDGRAVAIWLRERRPIIGICSDLACSSVSERATGGGNTDTRPAIVIRPDGRPFAYYSAFGGTAAWDCSDANCTSGTARFVSGTGSSTSSVAELALRSDGVPMMIYHNNSNSVFVFTCADINCSSGTSRLLVAEGANTILSGFTTEMRSDNRLIVSYLRFNINDSSIVRRVALCADMNCSNSVVTSSGGAVGSFSGPSPIALRDNNLPNVVNPFPTSAQLRLCVSEDCLDAGGSSILPINLPNNSSTMRLAPGNIPMFDTGMVGSGGLLRCADASCSTAAATTVISSVALASSNFFGRLRLNATHQPVLVFDETVNEDVWLAVPLSERVFQSGFE